MFVMPDRNIIIPERYFPQTGTYLGTVVEPPDPEEYVREFYEELDDWDLTINIGAARSLWETAKRVSYSARYTVIESDSTSMVQYRRLKDPSFADSRPTLIDVYARPEIAIREHRPRMSRKIQDDMHHKLNAINIPLELRPIWLPLGQQALNKVVPLP